MPFVCLRGKALNRLVKVVLAGIVRKTRLSALSRSSVSLRSRPEGKTSGVHHFAKRNADLELRKRHIDTANVLFLQKALLVAGQLS
jgi:hypothetical protein